MLTNLHFLYVEDDQYSREIMRMILTVAAGVAVANIVIFEDSTDFMTRLKALLPTPDVIMLDIHMKPIDGFELLRLIRAEAEYRGVKIIALTASVMNEEVRQLRRSGFDGAIAKPLGVLTFPELLSRITAGETIWHIV